MYPQTHFLFPFTIAFILNKIEIFPFEFVLIAAVFGVIIDIDHYIEHILLAKTNKFSIIKAWNVSSKFHIFQQRSFIHKGFGISVMTIIFIITALFWPMLTLAHAIGYYTHIILDYIHLRREKYLRFKIGRFYIKESYAEITLDIFLIIIILALI